jgi:hypothetical protein
MLLPLLYFLALCVYHNKNRNESSQMKYPVFYYLPSGLHEPAGLWGVPLVTAVGGP